MSLSDSKELVMDVDVHQDYHPRFNHASGDVVFVSVDGIKFRLHQKHLGSLTDGLSADGLLVHEKECVHLTETSATLEILFQFVVPQKLPDLSGLTFGLLGDVAEAAEKYVVFSAMCICSIRMLDRAEDYPVEVLIYALKHDYRHIANIAAKAASCHPLKDVILRLHPRDAGRWALYYEDFREIFRYVRRLYIAGGKVDQGSERDAKTLNKAQHEMCGEWYSVLSMEISRLEGLHRFKTLQEEVKAGSRVKSSIREGHDLRCSCNFYLGTSVEEVFALISRRIEQIPLFFPDEVEEEEREENEEEEEEEDERGDGGEEDEDEDDEGGEEEDEEEEEEELPEEYDTDDE